MSRNRRGDRVAAGDRSPEAWGALRPWLRFRWGKRRHFERYLVESAMHRKRAAAQAHQRSRIIAKGGAVISVGLAAMPAYELLRNGTVSTQGFAFLAASAVAAGVATSWWRAGR